MIYFSVTERTSVFYQRFLKDNNIDFSTRRLHPYGAYRLKNNVSNLDFTVNVEDSDIFIIRQLEILLIKSNIQELEIQLEEERMELKKTEGIIMAEKRIELEEMSFDRTFDTPDGRKICTTEVK